MATTVGVVIFPGTNCEMDAVSSVERLGGTGRLLWHADEYLGNVDAVIVPGEGNRRGPVRRRRRSGGWHLQRFPGSHRVGAASRRPPEERGPEVPVPADDVAG